MARGTVYKSISSVRRSPVPRSNARASSGSSFFGMLSKLSGASDRLNRSRKRR